MILVIDPGLQEHRGKMKGKYPGRTHIFFLLQKNMG